MLAHERRDPIHHRVLVAVQRSIALEKTEQTLAMHAVLRLARVVDPRQPPWYTIRMAYRAVIFDIGGVIVGSPLHAIADYERELGILQGAINRVVVESGHAGGWSRLERGELSIADFVPVFELDCANAGVTICARELMTRIASVTIPRPAMLAAVERLRVHGLAVAALTNNWASESAGSDGRPSSPEAALRDLFDVFVESAIEGLRKPDPAIYRLTCERLGVDFPEAVFLDDIGRNLKTARELGMATIKVTDPDQALTDLETLLGVALR
jgi:putative hydrolase of the HAD superfamily